MGTGFVIYKNYRHLLRRAIEYLGYELDKSHSSPNDLTFKHVEWGDVVIISRRTNFERFFSPRSDEHGDVVEFLKNRAGEKVEQNRDFTLSRSFIDSVLIDLAGSVPGSKRSRNTTAVSETQPMPFNAAVFDIRPLPDSPEQLPRNILNLLRSRHISPELLYLPEFEDSIAIQKYGDIPNLLFLWRNIESGQLQGAQSKYLSDGKTRRAFLPGSQKSVGFWHSSIGGRRKIFLVEDPFDALAHRTLYPDPAISYFASGGNIATEQISLLTAFAKSMDMQIILGNDRDAAGMLSNLRVCTTIDGYRHDKRSRVVTVTIQGVERSFDYSDSLEPFVEFVSSIANKGGMMVDVPAKDDWNAELIQIQSIKI